MSTPPQQPIPEFLAGLLRDDVRAFLNGQPGPSELFDYKVALDRLVDAVEVTAREMRSAAVAAVNASFVG